MSYLQLLILIVILVSDVIHSSLLSFEYIDDRVTETVLWERFIEKKLFPTLFLLVTADGQRRYSDTGKPIFESIIYAIGPFSAHFRIVSNSTISQWLHDQNVTLRQSISLSDSQSNSLLVFDHFEDILSYEVIPLEIFSEPLALKNWISNRYHVGVRFIIPEHSFESNLSYELKWAHFRGNTKLFRLNGDQGAVLTPAANQVIQYTAAGHLFVLMKVDPVSFDCQSDKDTSCTVLESIRGKSLPELSWSSIVGLYYIPAFRLPQSREFLEIEIRPHHDQYLNISLLHEYQHIYDILSLEDRSNYYHFIATHRECLFTSNCSILPRSEYLRMALLTYWEFQRKSQIWLSQMYLPSVSQRNFSRQSSDGSINNRYYKVIELPTTLMTRLKSDYLSRRQSDNSDYITEDMISMVFNQDQSPTYYLPLSSSDLRLLEQLIIQEASEWLNISTSDLIVTGSYGIREYRQNAIIRWHVDPVESQPITAIIHIADADRCNREELTIDEKEYCFSKNWPLYLPRYPGYEIGSFEYEEVILEEGEALLLQSAKIPHARLIPLTFAYYANAFVHLSPREWKETPIVTAFGG